MKTMQLDKRQISRSFGRAAKTYDRHAFLQHEVAKRVRERLRSIKIAPQEILDIGCATGKGSNALRRVYRSARVVGIDLAQAMVRGAYKRRLWYRHCRFVCADAERLPFADQSFDFVHANLTLQWCDLSASMSEAMRVLKPGGLLFYTCVGPDTLKELREAWRTTGEGVPRVHEFMDMHDLGDAMMQHGFTNPVMEVEHIQLAYKSVEAVLKELKGIGAVNAANARIRGLTGKTQFNHFRKAYQALADARGRIPASYEIIYGHAWVPEIKRSATHERSIPIRPMARSF